MTTLPDHLAHLTSLTKADLEIRKTVLRDVIVSTMLLPAGKRAGQFETMVLGDNSEWDGWCAWSADRAAADATHERILGAICDGRDLDEAMSR